MISVAVLIYKVEIYLRKCIDSILSQTYEDLEIILVDDGSPDNCGLICDEYSKKDPRIHVIHKENGGPSNARNTAIEYAHGDFIIFFDGDDYVEPQMLEILLQMYQSGNYSLAMALGRIVDENYSSTNEKYEIENVPTLVFTQKDMFKGLFNLKSINAIHFQVAWNKLYPMDLVKDLRFKSLEIEDIEFNSRFYQKIDKTIFVNLPLYNWVQRGTSITHQKLNEKKINKLDVYYSILQSFSHSQKEYRAYCLDKMYKVMLHLRYHTKKKNFSNIVKDKCKKYVGLTRKELINNDSLPTYRKYFFLLFYYIPWTYDIFMFMIEKRAKLR